MARNVANAVTPAADSPRHSQSPPPGIQGDLEMELMGLANALYNLGTTVVTDASKDQSKPGAGKQVGQRVNEVINHLASIDDMAQHCRTMIPMQVLMDIDNSKNPMQLTRDRLERAATENQFMNAKIKAVDSYRHQLLEALGQNFPDIEPVLRGQQEGSVSDGGSNLDTSLAGPSRS